MVILLTQSQVPAVHLVPPPGSSLTWLGLREDRGATCTTHQGCDSLKDPQSLTSSLLWSISKPTSGGQVWIP